MRPNFARPNLLFVLADYLLRALAGQRHLPPYWLRDVGPGDYESTGREFLAIFTHLVQVQPHERVLEIGSGCGRMAMPLASHLVPPGSYTGMDITAKPVLWCQQHIARQAPHFQFMHIDLYNKRYNSQGRYQAQDYVFPFKDHSFDFIFLTSVFTHMLPPTMEHYLQEISRLLHPQGRSLITFFLLNGQQQDLARQERNDIDFRYGSGPYRMRDEAIPESAVAYEEDYLFGLLAHCGLAITTPIHYGSWSGREDGLSYQDIIILRPA